MQCYADMYTVNMSAHWL